MAQQVAGLVDVPRAEQPQRAADGVVAEERHHGGRGLAAGRARPEPRKSQLWPRHAASRHPRGQQGGHIMDPVKTRRNKSQKTHRKYKLIEIDLN